jgi:sulfur carrier protein
MAGAPHVQLPNVTVNGEPSEIPDGCSIERLLGLLDVRGRRVAVALNRAVVPRSSYTGTIIRSGDRIEILEAVGGG